MAEQLSTAEQEQRHLKRLQRRAAREAREKEAARWVLPPWLVAVILIGGSILAASVGALLAPALIPETSPGSQYIQGAVAGAVGGVLISAGVLGGLQLPPRWWYVSAAFPVGIMVFFAGADALGAEPWVRWVWIVCTVLIMVGYFWRMIMTLTAPRSWRSILTTTAVSLAAVLIGVLAVIRGLTSDKPLYLGYWTINGAPIDYTFWYGMEPIAYAAFGLAVVTLGAMTIYATVVSIIRKTAGSPRSE